MGLACQGFWFCGLAGVGRWGLHEGHLFRHYQLAGAKIGLPREIPGLMRIQFGCWAMLAKAEPISRKNICGTLAASLIPIKGV